MEIPSHIASQLYANAQAAARPAAPSAPGEGSSFAEMAASLLESMRAGERVVTRGMTGKADAHSIVQALAATEVAVQTAVTVRDRVVEAYQEILRMPV